MKACLGQTLILIRTFVNYDRKNFIKFGPSGLYYKSFTIVFYDRNDIPIVIYDRNDCPIVIYDRNDCHL